MLLQIAAMGIWLAGTEDEQEKIVHSYGSLRGNIIGCKRAGTTYAEGRHRGAFAKDSPACKKVSSHCLSLLVDGGAAEYLLKD